MRQSLMKTFDEIFVFDLHGNSLKKETTPDGRKDENVFDIRVGVVISLFIKNDKKKKFSQVFHGQLFGDRETKYSHLSNNHIGTVSWDSIHPSTKFYIFNPRDSSNEAKYYQFPAVTEIFQEFSTGITTGRDAFAFDFDKNILSRRIEQFRDISFSDEMISVTYKLSNTSSWNLSNSRKATMKLADWQQNILICDFRPFDKRFLYYDSNLVDRTRHEIMRHMLSENLGLVTVRQVAEGIFNHCIITDTIVNSRMTLSSRGRGYLFPLYLYSDKEKVDLFSFDEPEKVTNFSKEFKELLTVNYAQIPTPEVVIAYMYSILYSNIYRRIYATYLKSDFPRIPFTSDLQVFNEIAKLGQRLINLHLLKSPELDHPVAKYQGLGDDHVITRPNYSEVDQQLYINSSYYFEGLRPEVWNYQLGGYQVLDKYLKERKGRRMDDPRYFIRVATALAKTIEIQEEIDAIYPEVEKNVISFKLSD